MAVRMYGVGGAFFAGFGATRGVYRGLRRWQPGGVALGERTNFAGRVVDLCAGPAVVAGCVVGAVLADVPGRARGAVVVAVVGAGVCGAYDDFVGAGDRRRGFRAHLGALRRGEVTSGAVKLFGVGAAGLIAGALVRERLVDKVLAGVVIAGTAHLVNLVDVRPGRAAGAVFALGVPGLLGRGTGRALAAAPMGAAAAVAVDDVEQRTMLGDTGAHALGAALGVAVAAGRGRTGLVVHAAALIAAAAHGDR
ncbi:hypothetical protein ABCR94_21805 [Streptomyces sp. 21So2-11]|uniref:hypothetical protein n=1 Tax=Streptomyces sp. 21So2-11 TaxID=3144408 RepID=UPI0032197CBD